MRITACFWSGSTWHSRAPCSELYEPKRQRSISELRRKHLKSQIPALSKPQGTTATDCELAIVGGGLGGLAVAAGLRDSGIDWRLFEAAGELRTSTGTIAAQGKNSYNALASLDPDLTSRIWSLGASIQGIIVSREPSGKEAVAKASRSPDLIMVQWADMQAALVEKVILERVSCRHRAVAYKETEEHSFATVMFQDKEPVRARMVVAADGVRSAMRQCMLPADADPRYLGHMNWNALVPMERCPRLLESYAPANFIAMRDGVIGQEWSTMLYLAALPGNMVFWQVRIASQDISFTAPLDAQGRPRQRGPPGCKQRLIDQLLKIGWPDVAEVVEATAEADIFERPIVDVLPLPRWSSEGGRVVLLGDAAHAMHPGPGLGARSAFEDADQLVQAIKAHWPDTRKIVQQYEAVRMGRTARLQQFSAEYSALEGIRASDSLRHLSAEQRRLRATEFDAWLAQYPRNITGDPGSTYWQPL